MKLEAKYQGDDWFKEKYEMHIVKTVVFCPTLSDDGRSFPSCFQTMRGNGNPDVLISILIGLRILTRISFSGNLLKSSFGASISGIVVDIFLNV